MYLRNIKVIVLNSLVLPESYQILFYSQILFYFRYMGLFPTFRYPKICMLSGGSQFRTLAFLPKRKNENNNIFPSISN